MLAETRISAGFVQTHCTIDLPPQERERYAEAFARKYSVLTHYLPHYLPHYLEPSTRSRTRKEVERIQRSSIQDNSRIPQKSQASYTVSMTVVKASYPFPGSYRHANTNCNVLC